MPTTSSFETDRLVRQQELVPGPALAQLIVTVIGVGAIGRQAALQLAAIGVRHIQLVDFDAVDEANVTTQGYLASDVGQLKVQATKRAIQSRDPTIDVEAIEDRYRPRRDYGEAVFCGVDSIAVRATIWRSIRSRCRFWADGRMLGETMRVLVVAGEVGYQHYPQTLFAASEAEPGRCTAHSTIYTANIAAGLMIHQFARYLRRQEVDADTTFNLLAGELVVSRAE